MCFNFLTGRTGPSMGPQSSADKAAGGYRPPGSSTTQTNAGNPQSDTATPQGQRSAVISQQTADRNTIRRADSYGSQLSSAKQSAAKVVKEKKTYNQKAVASGQNIMSALNTYNTNKAKKTILGS